MANMVPLKKHPHYALAKGLAALPPDQNPLTNPAAMAGHPPNVQQAIAAVAAHPELSQIATNGVGASPMVDQNQTQGAPGGDDPKRLQVNQSGAHRTPDVRHNVVGFAAAVFAGAGTATLTARPQVRFKPNRLVIPSSTLAGSTISNMLVGAKPQYAASSVEPADMFEEQSTGAQWDMDVCDIGQVVTFSATVLGATTLYAALVGEALDGKAYPLLRSRLKRIGFSTAATVAAGATSTITITPQVRFKTRKVIVDDTIAQYFTINSLQVGIQPQFMSGDPVPAACFTEVAQDLWLDLDEAYVGNVITFNVTNNGAGAHLFAGALSGDVDPRDVSQWAR